jgi:hypothetical protein
MLDQDHRAALLLRQMIYWYETMGHQSFYKFTCPPEGEHGGAYKEGDSWCEEMGMSYDVFVRTRDKIATRVDRELGLLTGKYDVHGKLLGVTYLVMYWRSHANRTKYVVNMPLVYAYQALELGTTYSLATVDISGFTLELGDEAKSRLRQMPVLTSGNASHDLPKPPSPISVDYPKTTQKKKQTHTGVRSLFVTVGEVHLGISPEIEISKALALQINDIVTVLERLGVTVEDVLKFPAWNTAQGRTIMSSKPATIEKHYVQYLSQKRMVRESEDVEARQMQERSERRSDLAIK